MKHPKGDGKSKRILAAGVPYQGDRLTAALPFLHRRGHAVDVGAHIGLWTIQLAAIFERVTAFEPHPDSYGALVENTAHLTNVASVKAGLGAKSETVRLTGASIGAHVGPDGAHQVQIAELDDLDLGLVDFLKIDVEGFEPFVVAGGELTIKRDRPVIVIEQKHDMRYGQERFAAVTILQRWGASIEWKMKNDYCLRWR